MSTINKEKLARHIGHNIICVGYALELTDNLDLDNVAIECAELCKECLPL